MVLIGDATLIRSEFMEIPCEGDLDGDRDIDLTDLQYFTISFGSSGCTGSCMGDFNGDGDMDGSDLEIIASMFGRKTCTD